MTNAPRAIPMMGSPTDEHAATTVRLSGPEQLAALVPYMMGFVPLRSVVVLYFHNRRVATTMRLDLDASHQDVVAAARAVSGNGLDEAVVVAFEEDTTIEQVERMLDEMSAAVRSTGTQVHAEMIVSGDSVRQRGQAPSPLADHAHLAAPFVALGVSPLPSREALERALAPSRVPDGLEDALSAAGPVGARECAQAWAEVLDPAAGPVAALPAETLTAAMVGLADVETRDAIVAQAWPLGGGEIPGPLREALGEVLDVVAGVLPSARGFGVPRTVATTGRLVDLAGATPAGRYRDDVITVAATGLYWAGQGADANILLEEAAGHGNRMAALLGRMLANGLKYRP